MNGIVTNLYQEKRTPVTCCWKTEEILKLQKCHHFKLHCAISLFPKTFNQCRKNLTGEAAKNHSQWRKNWLWIVMFWQVAVFAETYSLYMWLIFKVLWINQNWNLIPFTRNGSTEIRIFLLTWFWCFKYFLLIVIVLGVLWQRRLRIILPSSRSMFSTSVSVNLLAIFHLVLFTFLR